MVRTSRSTTTASSCFNGAAVFTAEMAEAREGEHEAHLPRFNGAAVFTAEMGAGGPRLEPARRRFQIKNYL